MSTSFDLNLLPIHRFAGQDQASLPGLYLASPPRRTARGRAADHLLLYLSLTGNSPLSAGKGEQILEQLSGTYYKTSGSVTAGLRAVVDSLNEFLLDRNVRSASTGRQGIGLLSLALLRQDRLYLAQSGPVHAFVINAEGAQYLYDPQLSGRGLGLSRSAPIRYYQTELQSNDLILLAARPSSTWTAAALAGSAGQDAEQLRRRLLNRQDLDLNAVIVQVRPATGRRQAPSRLAPEAEPLVKSAPQGEVSPADSPAVYSAAAGSAAPDSAVQDSAPLAPRVERPARQVETPAMQPVVETSDPTPAAESYPAPPPASPVIGAQREEPAPAPNLQAGEDEPAVVGLDLTAAAASPSSASTGTAAPAALPAPAAPPPPRKAKVRTGAGDLLAGFGQLIVATLARMLGGLRRGLGRLLPGESLFTIPATTMVAIAVIVPVIVVAVASKVYIDRGLMAKYQDAMDKAQLAAENAPLESDPVRQRQIWEAGLAVLATAEAYQPGSTEVRTMRAEALGALDALDLVNRLRYRPAIISGLPQGVNVTRLVQADDDLYMLDSQSGSVLRGRVTNSLDFELDMAFQCGPTYATGRLVDIVPLPLGSTSDAVLKGLDTSGNLISCFTNSAPRIESLAVPVTAPNWGTLTGLTYDVDGANLYVLDPADQAVWIYWGGVPDTAPEFFFGAFVPPMSEVIDLAVDKRDMYMLHKDGTLKLCTYSLLATSPTRCTEMPYTDARRGLEGQTLTPPTPFTQVYASSPPDPSLYLLEPGSQSIYRFSLRTLSYYRQFKPAEELAGGPATAFTINVLQRMVFLAAGNRVYQATLP